MNHDSYLHYIKDESWLIKENQWEKKLQNVRESQFALGNGYLGTRGVLEEIPYDSMPGTYIAGVYDKMASQVAEIVNLPNPFNFKFTVNGEKLGVIAMDVVEHKRILNLKNGILLRHTLYKNSKKSRFDYHSLRFVSMSDKNIGVMQIVITPLDKPCIIDINTGIDVSVYNTGVLTEGRKRHFRVKELSQERNAGYLTVETMEKKHVVMCWEGFYYEADGKKVFAKDNIFRLKLKKRQKVIFTKIFYMKRFSPSEDITRCKRNSFNKFYKVFHSSLDYILRRHIKAWEKLWDKADVIVESKRSLQQNLRFGIYHMLIAGSSGNGFSSIGARTLSGEGYRGHVFWDSEIFLMPFYLFTVPEVSRNMLIYRYRRIDAAKEIAKRSGFKGAMFPWESAGTGFEDTPGWAKDIDGSIVRIFTHKMEHHITADIAYAVYLYYLATGDGRFMREYGYEIIFETARFWASRVRYDRRNNVYHIDHVIGPDEFHIDICDNAYTNVMAKWNMLIAHKMFCVLRRQSPRMHSLLKKKLKLASGEARMWKKIASLLPLLVNKNGVIEQFKGYFKLRKVTAAATDENGFPVVSGKLKTKDFAKTQLIKQADVLMLMYLLPDLFPYRAKKINYDFYIKRVMHKSSLSPSIHAAMACECGQLQQAYNLFNFSLHIDISNVYGNTAEGIHAASLGGTWQAVIFGFAGVTIKKGRLFINPRLPHGWQAIVFSLLWRGDVIKLRLTNDTIKIKIVSRDRRKKNIGIFKSVISIEPDKNYTFSRKAPVLKREYYY
ncbi:MAG: hypothetical protein B1H08_01160 [Candidatus Omnitrophica bacterium 4484_171]|nr:MAG: hypothetical protein B1H08_01160 [Candidatus Omnitrophica bacterium 4484_171]